MEFNFNINNYFKDEITKVGSRLIPENFIGDRREVQDCLSKVSYVLTILGEKSAKAQGLQKVITSGEKLRNSDHVVYILKDAKGGSRGFGTVVGMLKIGVKHLYVFDATGNSLEVTTKCVLDFYVHESKQRMGLGKKLFQHMLKEERVDPVHLAIDKPSSKFLSFLLKHYGLKKVIPQMNNFVVFDGFFSNRAYGGESGANGNLLGASNSVESRFSSGSSKPHQFQSVSSIALKNTSYYGRQAPHKPVSTMGMILQHKSSPSQPATPNSSATEKGNREQPPPTTSPEVEPDEKEAEPEKEDIPIPETPIQEEETVVEKAPPEEEPEIPSLPVSPPESLKSPSDVSQEKIRVNSQGYMDLKFYHSSLW